MRSEAVPVWAYVRKHLDAEPAGGRRNVNFTSLHISRTAVKDGKPDRSPATHREAICVTDADFGVPELLIGNDDPDDVSSIDRSVEADSYLVPSSG